MLIKCYVKGAVVGVNGGSVDANPYGSGTAEYADWRTGYWSGRDAAERMQEAKANPEGLTDRLDPQVLI